MIYLTGDFHFDHNNLWQGMRKEEFSSLEEMNHVIWDNLFTRLKRKDTLCCLGDLAMKDTPWVKKFFEEIQKQCINLIFVRGNHDKSKTLNWLRYFDIPWYELFSMKINTQRLVLCHYPMRTWDQSHRGSYHAHAHSHGNLCPVGKSWDVGVDNNAFLPLSWNEFIDIMKLLTRNVNEV